MTHLADHGYPVPTVFDADGPDLVMQRLYGPTMGTHLTARPWHARDHARTLAALHRRLHCIPAPEGLRHAFGTGDRVLHLDLHPDNVILTSAGPYVIDFSNAGTGSPGADVAQTIIILTSDDLDTVPTWQRPAARGLIRWFLRWFTATAGADPTPHLAQVAHGRLTDPNLRPAEAARIHHLLDTGAPSA